MIVPLSVNLYPNRQIQFLTRYFAVPHGCTPNEENYPLPWWQCVDGLTMQKWSSIGNGGAIPDHRWAAAVVPGGEPYDYTFTLY